MKSGAINEMLRLACIYAIQDREGFVAVHEHMPSDPATIEALQFIKQLSTYMKRRWPGKSDLQRLMDQAKEIDPLMHFKDQR